MLTWSDDHHGHHGVDIYASIVLLFPGQFCGNSICHLLSQANSKNFQAALLGVNDVIAIASIVGISGADSGVAPGPPAA